MSRIDFFVNGLNPSARAEYIPRQRSGPRPGLAPEQDFDCPMCDGKLARRYSKRYRRYFYGCVNFLENGCNGSVGCHPDGRPLGIPVDQEGKDWRKKAHKAFDALWKEGELTRKEAYYWMKHDSGVGIGHIGEMNIVQCKELINAVDSFDLEVFLDNREFRESCVECDRGCSIYEYPRD